MTPADHHGELPAARAAAGRRRPAGLDSAIAEHLVPWRGLLLTSGVAAMGSAALTVVQVVLGAIWLPVHTVPEVFDLMERAPVLGLISLDVLFILNNILVLLLYLGLCVVLWPISRSGVTVAFTLGLLQMAAYLESNPAVEMLDLGRRFAAATGERQGVLVAAGEAVLVAWKGTAFLTFYLLGAAVLLVFASLLLRSTVFAGWAPWWALAAGLLMLVPSTFGVVGIVFSLLSLIPWVVFCVLAGRRLLQLGRRPPASRAVADG